EGATFQCGTEVVTFSIGNFTFGLTICYDLRFPELFRKMAGVDAVILPAAFIHHTGKDHWEVLLRARAIENQCYVIAASQGGIHDSGRHTFGHSMLINPWGAITSIIKDGEGIIMGKLEKQIIKQIRTQLPALEHRRV
ncbi:MAG: nitrilase-related carbon-nitrogen hydrolase, partial [Burkholderiales bacterium]